MKSASLKLFVPAVALTAQLASSNFVPVWPREPSIQNRSSVPLGRLFSSMEARDLHFNIFGRQQVCENAGYGKFMPFSSEMTQETNYDVKFLALISPIHAVPLGTTVSLAVVVQIVQPG